MAICNFEAPNGRKSLLFAGLSQLLGEDKATQAWYMMRSPKMLSKTGDWTRTDTEVKVPQDENGEPSVETALALLGLGTYEQAQQHTKLVSRWHLTPIQGTLNEYAATRSLAQKMHKQLQKSRDQYAGLSVLYNATSNRFEIRPRTEVFASVEQSELNPKDFHNHSGGAIGADTEWDRIGREFGVVNHHHYWHGTKNPLSKDEDEITKEEFEEGKKAVLKANKTLQRKPENYMNLLARNWMQVANADMVVAVSTLASSTEVNGGTGWAVQMAIDAGKWVYVFDQVLKQWKRWDGEKFADSNAPVLPWNFAGIGTRKLNDAGRAAIRQVYENTFGVKSTSVAPINIYSGENNGYQKLSNLLHGPVTVGGVTYPTVEHGFQHAKAVFAGDSQTAAKILETKSGFDAQKLGRTVKGLDSSAWDAQSRSVLKTIMSAAFAQNQSTRELLVSTGTAQLTHKSTSGASLGRWEKEFPEILMEIRSSYKNTGPTELNTDANVVLETATEGPVYDGTITTLSENQVFVFGANDQGLHGKGAAGIAMGKERDKKEVSALKKGTQGKWAVIGEHSRISTGTEGKSYGIVTVKGELGNKDVNNRVSESEMLEEIQKFYKTAEENPQLEFLVAYTGESPKKKNLSGFTTLEMANLFGAFPVPENVKFERRFYTLMGNSPRKFIAGELVLQDQSTRLPLQIDEQVIEEARKKLQIEIRDAEGNGTGKYFSADQQVQATNSIIYSAASIIHRKKSTNDTELRDEILTRYLNLQKALAVKAAGVAEENDPVPQFSQQEAASMHTNLTNVINTFNQLFKDSLKRMRVYGINVKELDNVGGEYSEMEVQEGRGLENFNSLIFTLDPRDTASGRLKLFMATVEESVEGIIPRPRTIRLPMTEEYREQVAAGTRNATVRTAQQLKDMRMDTTAMRNKGAVKFGDKWYVVQVVKELNAVDAAAYNESDNSEADHQATEGDYLLSITPFTEEKGIVPINSFIGIPQIAEFESLFEDVTGILADRKPSFDGYVEALRAAAKPNLRRLADKLTFESTPDKIRKEFVAVMSKAYTQYALVQYSGSPEKGMKIQMFNANRYSARKVIIKTWQEMQKLSPILQRDVSGNFSMDENIVQELKGAYMELQARMKNKNMTADETAAVAEKARQLVRRMFEVNGMNFTDAMYKDLFDNISKLTKDSPLESAGILPAWHVTEAGEPRGIFSAFLTRIIRDKAETDDLESGIERNNPLYREPTTMRILSAWYARHTEVLYNSSHRDIAGNNIWDYTLNTYLTKAFNELTGKDPAYREQLKQSYFARNNWLLQYWDAKEWARENTDILYLEGLKKRYGKKNAEREAMSDRDQLFMALGMFMNQGRAAANYIGMTHSDKTRTPVFTNMPRTKVMAKGSQMDQELITRLYSVFEAEFDRIHMTAGQIYEQQQFEAGKKYFYMLPVFNYDNMVKLRDAGLITEEDLALIWITKDTLNAPAKATTEAKTAVLKVLAIFTRNEIERQLQQFRDTGIIDDTKMTHMFDVKYLNSGILERQARIIKAGNQYFDNSSGQRVEISQREYFNKMTKFVAMDFVMNGFLFNAAMVQLIYGDPAQVFKKNVEATLTEYQKRMAGIIAPGKETEWVSPDYYAVTLADMEMGLDYIKNIQQYHSGVNVTDAQEFVTMEEHLNVMLQYGQLDKDTYDQMMQVIKPGEYYEFTDPAHLKVVLQITKPVYYGKRKLEKGVLLHDYVKSSAMPLYPPFTANLEIDKLRRDMETGILKDGSMVKISRAHFVSAKKIGYPQPSKSFDGKGTYKGIAPGAVQVLSREGFRIQQEVPHDPNKDEIQIASQSNKLFTADMPQSVALTLRSGKELKGPAQIRQYKEELRIRMLQENKKAFMEEMEIVEDPELGYTFSKPEKFLKKLIEIGKEKNYSDNELQPLAHIVNGKPISPLFFTSLAEPIQNMMMSMVDDLIKVKLQGKSYVQASSVGLTRMLESTENIKGITWLPGSDPSRQLRMPEKTKDGVNAAEILVPFHFFSGNRKMKLQEVLNEDGTLNLEKLPAELLEMIGIRIPTSKQNSMLPMRIVGFLPENMGDTIIVPPGITVQMGSDFDVDKLFVYRRPYSAQDTGLVPDTDDKAEYFDLMWHTLLSPDMYEVLMSPLDKTDLKDEAALVGMSALEGNFFTPRRQLADFLSQKDAKRLVGFGALSNTFLAGVQDLNLFVGLPVFDEDGKLTGYAPDPIKTFGGLKVYRISGYGTSTYKGETRTKLDNIGIMLSEFLDHAKNRTIDKLNLTVHTYSAAAALMSLETEEGEALNLTYVSRLLTQDIIRKFNLRMQRGADMLGSFVPNLKETVLLELENELKSLGATETEHSYSAEELADLLKADKKSDAYLNAQLDLLKAFTKLDQIGTRMSEMSALLNQDVNGTGGNLFNVMDKISKIDDVLGNNTIINGEDLVGSLEAPTEKGYLFDMVNSLADSLFEPYMPHKQVFNSAIKTLQLITGRSSATQIPMQTRKDILKSLRSYVYSQTLQELGVENVNAERARLLYNTDQGPSLAERVFAAQKTWGERNYLLRRLQPEIGNGQSPSYVTFIASKVTRMDDQENVRAWMELLTSTDKEKRLLGEDLVKYVYLTGGNQDASNFVRYVPFGFLMSTGWFEALDKMYTKLTLEDSTLLSGPFLEQWIRHNPEQALEVKLDVFGIKGTPESFVMPFDDPESSTSPSRKFVVKMGNDTVYTPYVSLRTEDGETFLYKKTGSVSSGVEYSRMDTLGDSLTDEYDATSEDHRSIIQQNRAFNTQWKGSGFIQKVEPVTSTAPVAATIPVTEELEIPQIIRSTLKLDKVTTSLDEFRNRVIPEIIAEGKIPQYYATLYRFFQQFAERTEELEKMVGLESPEFTIRVGSSAYDNINQRIRQVLDANNIPTLELGMGMYTANSNELILGTGKAAAHKNIHETLLHELTHWAVSPLVENTLSNENPDSRIMMAVRTMEELYAYVKKARPDLMNSYAMGSLHEFIVGGTTDRKFMKELNSIKYKHQSMLAKLLSSLAELLSAIGEFLGVPIDPQSVLMEFFRANAVLLSDEGILLDVDTVMFNKQPVRVAVDAQGKAVSVGNEFMQDSPEPLRQLNISAILSQYNVDKDVDAGNGERFRGAAVETETAVEGPEGKYELFPGVYANQRQREAIDKIPQHIRTAKGTLAERSFVLSGAGGTGKTTIIRKIAEQFPGKSIAFAAPSHNAVVELKAALRGGPPVKGPDNFPFPWPQLKWPVNTLQSELRMKLDGKASYEQGKDVFIREPIDPFKEESKLPKSIETADVIILDESSMIDDQMVTWLNEAIRSDAVVIWLGDYAQLPPVGSSNTSWPFREVMQQRGVMLLENMRTSKADVAAVLTQYRKGIDATGGEEANYRLPIIPYTGRIASENVSLFRNPNEFINEYVKAFKQDPTNPKNALIISYRNETRKKYNTAIRNLLFGERAAEKYTDGDLVIVNRGLKPKESSAQRILEEAFGTDGLFPAQRVIVKDYEAIPEYKLDFKFRDRTITVKLPGERLTVNLGPEADHAEVSVLGFTKEGYSELVRLMKAAPYKDKSLYLTGAAANILGVSFIKYSEWMQLVERLGAVTVDFDYAYAVTSHKSQGSTYNHTFVDEYDIATVGPASRKDLVHSLYTAVSRTREHLYVYHPAQQFTVAPAATIMKYLGNTVANNSNGPWEYRTEEEAIAAEQKVNTLSPQLTTDRDGKILAFFSIDPKKETKKASTRVQRVIDKLIEQRSKIRKSMTSVTDRTVRAEKRLQIQKLEEDIETLKLKGKMEDIAAIGTRQLQWVAATIKRDDPSVTDIMTAYHVTDVWSNIVDILFGDNAASSLPEIGDDLSALMTKARTMRSTLVNGKMRTAMTALSENRLSATDFTKGLQDMNGFSAYALSLNRASSQLVQEIDLFLKTAGRRAEAEMKTLFHQLEALDKKVNALGNRDDIFNMLVQDNSTGNAFGLVQQFSQDWFDERAKYRAIRTSRIMKLKSAVMDEATRKKNMQNTWRNYWKNIHTIGVFADITELFDEAGELLPDISKEKARLLDQLRDEALVDKMIRHAQHRYKEYLEHLQENSDAVDAKYEEGIITAEQAAQEKAMFVKRYSPVKFFRQMKIASEFEGLNEGDRYAVLYPKASKPEFYDDKYRMVQENAGLREIYDEYKDLMKKMRSYLPLYVQWEMHENFLPVVEQHLLHDMTAKEYLGSMNQRIRDSLTATKYEEERKDKDDIPIRFIHKDKEKTDTYSRDLVRIAEMFGMMAIHYKHFSQVKDAVDMGEVILKEAHRQRVSGLDDGQVLTNTLNALEYAKSYMMYKNARQLEVKTNVVLYSMNPLVQRRVAAKVKSLMIKRGELEKELIDPPKGKTIQDIRKEMEEVDEELTKIEGQNVYLSKVGDRLIGINQLKALAFNPFSGFANLAFGMASMAIYANGNRDFNMSQARIAMQMMTSSTRKYFTFGKSASPMAGKVLALMERTGILGDIVDSQYGESNLKGHQNKLKKAIDPYTFLRSSDYYMKGSVLVATMLGTKVTVDGKEISLWEAYDDEGNLKYPELEGWDHNNLEQAPAWEKFRNRALRISQIVMGNMDRNSPKLMNKYILGRLIGQFRASWLPEGWAARWEDEKMDVQLGRVIKGRYKTYTDIGLEGSITILLRQFLGMVGGNKDYFAGIYRDKDGKLVAESEIDMENMRRNFTGMMWTLSLMAAGLILKSLIPDDDDDESSVKEALMIVLNLSNRVNQDLQFYSSPDVANSLIRNVVPAFDVVNDYIKAVKATKKAIMSEDYDWDQAALKWTKATPYLNQINRAMYMTTHDISEVSR